MTNRITVWGKPAVTNTSIRENSSAAVCALTGSALSVCVDTVALVEKRSRRVSISFHSGTLNKITLDDIGIR